MRYYKIISDGHLMSIGIGAGGTEITAEEYYRILNIVNSAPAENEYTGYILRDDLTWEEFRKEIVELEDLEN